MEGRINAQSARSGRLNDEEFKRLIDAAGRLFTANIFVDDTPGLSIMELRTKCRRLKSEHDIGLIVVDYLQLMTINPISCSLFSRRHLVRRCIMLSPGEIGRAH